MKTLLRIAALFLLSSVAFAQGVMVAPQTALKVVNGITTPIANATITVCAANTSGIPCSPALSNSIFKDAALTQPLSNPFTSDAYGNYQFAIAPGNYTVTVTAFGFQGQSYQITVATPISLAGGLGDPGANGLVYRNGFNTTRDAINADVIALWTGTCNNSTFLRGDGQCVSSSAPVTSVFSRTGAVTAQSGDYSWAQIAAGSNLNSQTMGAAGSFSPVTSGQVAGNQLWIPQALLAPSTTGTLTGGTILASHNWQIQYTLNTAAGETTPSVLLSNSTQNLAAACTSGGSCTLTINAPSLTGYASWNLYACDTTGGPCTSPQKVGACTAITTNCTLTATVGTNTSSPPTINTAWLQPSNIQATPSVDSGSLFSAFYPSTDGNYHGWLTLDTQSCDPTTGPVCPAGTPVFFGRTYWNNLTANPVDYPSYPQAFKNSIWSFSGDVSLSGLTTTNQSRAIGVMVQNPVNDSGNRYSMDGIQTEVDLHGAATWNGAPDGEVSAFSGQISDEHTGGSIGGMGDWVARLEYFRQAGAATWGSCTALPCHGAVKALYQNSSTVAGANMVAAAIYANATDNTNGNATQAATIWLQPPASNARFGKANWGIYQNGWLNGFTGNVSDDAFKFDYLNATTPQKGVFQDVVFFGAPFTSGCGPTYCPAIASNNLNGTGTAGVAGATTSIPIWGSLQPNAGVATNQLVGATFATDFQCSVAGSTGTSYSYSIVAVDGTGFGTTAASSTCVVSAAATLNGSNYVSITMHNPVGSIYGTGAVRYDAYRTASSGTPSSTGFIGSLNCAQPDVELFIWNNVGICAINDQGTVATGTVPNVNTTGGIAAKGDYFFTRDKGQHFNTQAANNDYGGVATCAASTATVTFTRAYTSTPVIVVSDETAAGGARVSAKSASSFTITCTGATDVVDYIVVGNPN